MVQVRAWERPAVTAPATPDIQSLQPTELLRLPDEDIAESSQEPAGRSATTRRLGRLIHTACDLQAHADNYLAGGIDDAQELELEGVIWQLRMIVAQLEGS